jgi:RsiW-degrading membrane proteinase PrsW (M82 family)
MAEPRPRPVLAGAPPRTHRHGWWWKALLAGTALWVVTIVVTVLTSNVNLIPTLILLGSFLVPFSVVLFAAERISGSFSGAQLMVAFFVSGVLGVLGASLLEANLSQSIWTFLAVGFIEELVKGLLLALVGRGLVPKTASQGALLGSVVGAGFAAFESAGYAFNAAITSQGIDLGSLLQTEVLRAVLAPVGHVLWTAVLGAVLFGVSTGRERFRWSPWILLTFVGVALLHAAWDSSSDAASVLALLFNGQALVELQHGFLEPGVAAEVRALSTILYIVGLLLISAAGLLTLWLVLRHYRRAERLVQP